MLVDLNVFQPTVRVFEVNDLENEVSLDQMFDDLITLVGERNFDLYEGLNGQVTKL